MGCLNDNQGFAHVFGNIHLSGPCNRSCYFCIGQHMMALDPLNNLNVWPLKNIDGFVDRCVESGVVEVNVTGSNTDPLMCEHLPEIKNYLLQRIPNLTFGVRTNGVLIESNWDKWTLFDKASITIPSFNQAIYNQQMGPGNIPNLLRILDRHLDEGHRTPKVNIVLGPEILQRINDKVDLHDTLDILSEMGIERVNLREPYGQPHVGNPLDDRKPDGHHLGMPWYQWNDRLQVTYWDVHWVHVESVNLYANGNVSLTYPITKGHCDKTGQVKGQSGWNKRGRHRQQWLPVVRPKSS